MSYDLRKEAEAVARARRETEEAAVDSGRRMGQMVAMFYNTLRAADIGEGPAVDMTEAWLANLMLGHRE